MDNKLSPNQIFMKTIKYTIMRVLMPVIAVVISLVLLKVVTVFGLEKIEDDRIKLVFLAVWFVISILVYILIDTFFAYKFHAGQMAIITDAVSVNMIPDDMNDLAKDSLAYRFPSGNEFHTYKKLVKGSIQQLQMQLNTFAENRLRIPILGQLIRLCQRFVGHALSFTFDFVLCYTFWRDGKTLYTSAADGVAVYWDSWKRTMNNVLMLASFILVGLGIGFLFIGVIVAVVVSPASGPLAGALAGVLVAYFICKAIKTVIDTNLTIKSLGAYFEEAQYADYNSEEYENMCRYSKKYTKLYQKAINEQFAPMADFNDAYVDDFTQSSPLYDYVPEPAGNYDYSDTGYDYGNDYGNDYSNDYGNGYGAQPSGFDDEFSNSFANQDAFADPAYGNEYGDNGGYGNNDGYGNY